MAKFYGAIGYIINEKTAPDVITEHAIEKFYKGDLDRNTRKLEDSGELNDNINIFNQISILADPYANNHMYAMRYVRWRGAVWKITSVEVKQPKLILTLGGVYNGEVAK